MTSSTLSTSTPIVALGVVHAQMIPIVSATSQNTNQADEVERPERGGARREAADQVAAHLKTDEEQKLQRPGRAGLGHQVRANAVPATCRFMNGKSSAETVT